MPNQPRQLLYLIASNAFDLDHLTCFRRLPLPKSPSHPPRLILNPSLYLSSSKMMPLCLIDLILNESLDLSHVSFWKTSENIPSFIRIILTK